MANREKLIESLQNDHSMNAAMYLLSKVVFSDTFPELVDRLGPRGIECKTFAEYLEKDSE